MAFYGMKILLIRWSSIGSRLELGRICILEIIVHWAYDHSVHYQWALGSPQFVILIK
jgi:hypothetical protein